LPDLPVALQHPNEEFLAVAKFSLPDLIFPEMVKTYCDHATSQIHVYTDGSCKHQYDITSRFATYCVVIGWCQSDAERIQEAEKKLVTGKMSFTLQLAGFTRCSGEQSFARAELFATTRCFEEFTNIMVHTDSQFALHSVNLAKTTSQPWAWKNHSNFDLVDRLARVCHDSTSTQKMKAQQNPCELFPPLARYDSLGNMMANDGAIHAFDHLETSVALEQKQRHADLLVEGADVVAVYRLLLDLHFARAQSSEAVDTGEQSNDIQTLQHTLRDAITCWDPVSEWQIGYIEKRWLVHSAWGHNVPETVVQWFQQSKWPGSAEGPQAQSMGMSWTEGCFAIAIFMGDGCQCDEAQGTMNSGWFFTLEQKQLHKIQIWRSKG